VLKAKLLLGCGQEQDLRSPPLPHRLFPDRAMRRLAKFLCTGVVTKWKEPIFLRGNKFKHVLGRK